MFGPAVCVIPFGTPEEPVRIANESPFGLAMLNKVQNSPSKSIPAWHINDGTINDELLVAFGGAKASGLGRLNGEWAPGGIYHVELGFRTTQAAALSV